LNALVTEVTGCIEMIGLFAGIQESNEFKR